MKTLPAQLAAVKLAQVRLPAEIADRVQTICREMQLSQQEFLMQAVTYHADRVTQCKPLPVATPETIYVELQRVSQALADLEREQRAVGAQVGILVQAFTDPASSA